MDMQPAWARTHEPAGYMPRQTVQCILQLEQFYLMTGDRRYLKPIPAAIRWLEGSAFGRTDNGRYRLARYYEVGTNKPIYQHRTEKVNDLGYGLYRYDSDSTGVSGGWIFTEIDIDGIKRGYERVSALNPEQAKAHYKKGGNRKGKMSRVDPDNVTELLDTLNDRGAWVSEITVFNIPKTMTDNPRKTIRGIAVMTFVRNMRTLMNFLRQNDM